MSITVIDYSSMCFPKKLPAQYGGKFVLLTHGNDQYCPFMPIECAGYHANIVDIFAKKHHLSGYYNDKRDHFYLTTDGWVVHGGGHWYLDRASSCLRIYGRSLAYGGLDLVQITEVVEDSGVFDVNQIYQDPH